MQSSRCQRRKNRFLNHFWYIALKILTSPFLALGCIATLPLSLVGIIFYQTEGVSHVDDEHTYSQEGSDQLRQMTTNQYQACLKAGLSIPKMIQESRFFGCWRLKFASGEAVAESAVYLKTK